MNRFRIIVATSIVALSASSAAFGQGLSEMGGIYAMPKGGPGGVRNAVEGLYGHGMAPPQPGGSSGQGGRGGRGVVGLPSAAARLSPEQLAAYTTAAQRAYANGIAAMKSGKKDVAIKELGTAISIRERVWGTSDPAIAELARKQATMLKETGKSAEALNAWKKVLASESRQFGGGSPKLAKTLQTIASLADTTGNNHEALNAYRQLYAIQHKDTSAGDVKSTRLKLAQYSASAGDFNGAENVLREAIASEDVALARDSGYETKVYEQYAAILRQQGREQEAASMEQKATAMRSSSASSDASSTAPSLPPPSAMPAAPTAPATTLDEKRAR